MDVVRIHVDVVEEVLPQEAVEALRVSRRDAHVFVHVEELHVAEGELAFSVVLDELLEHGLGRGT